MWTDFAQHDIDKWQIDPHICNVHMWSNLWLLYKFTIYAKLKISCMVSVFSWNAISSICSRIAKNIFVVALVKAWSEFPLFFLWVIFTLCCEFTCDVKVGGEIYGGGWKGDLGVGTMDSEADNPEYLQHHGQKVLKWNKREGRTKVASGTGIWKSIWNLWSWFSQTQRIQANTVLV